MEKRIKILFVVPSLGQGGAETQLINLANGMDSSRFEKHLLCFEQIQSQLERLNTDDIVFHYLPRRRKFDFSLPARLASYIDKHQFDLVHATLQIGGYVAYKALQKARKKCPLIIAMHTTDSQKLKYEVAARTIFQRSMRSATKLAFVSDNQSSVWIGKYPWMKDRSVTIHNGIDCATFNKSDHIDEGLALLEKHDIDPALPVVSCIAAFRAEKNHKGLVRAVSRIEQKFTVCLAGVGGCRDEVEALVNKLGLQDRVRFIGRLSNIRPLLAVSTITVLASHTEAFSMAMLESLAMGVPMLATNVGGTNEAIIPNETGILIEPRDNKILENGIIDILSDAQRLKTMGENGAKFIRDNFTQAVMVEKTEKLLLECYRDYYG